MKKFREVLVYVSFGVLLVVDVLLVYFLISNGSEIFNTNIDYGSSLELGLLIFKGLIGVFIIVVNLKNLKAVLKNFSDGVIKNIPQIEGEEGYKRLGLIKRFLFYWNTNEARRHMDKYHENFIKLKKKIGKVRGIESKELKRLKEEMIKGILLWTEDFQITKIKIDDDGNEVMTNEPVDYDYLNSLYLEELYNIYAVKCIDTSEKFIHGRSINEKEIIV